MRWQNMSTHCTCKGFNVFTQSKEPKQTLANRRERRLDSNQTTASGCHRGSLLSPSHRFVTAL